MAHTYQLLEQHCPYFTVAAIYNQPYGPKEKLFLKAIEPVFP